MDLASDDFALFGLEPRFAQDLNVLSERWKLLQGQAHPDRFSNQGESNKRLAMQWSIRINQAYQRLKDPISRAAYCCELAGLVPESDTAHQLPTDFLFTQMQWREALDDAASGADLVGLEENVEQEQTRLLQQLEDAIDQQKDYQQAMVAVQKLRFIEKLLEATEEKYESFAN